MLLIYTHNITPRVRYTFKHICSEILGIPIAFTHTIEEFIAHDNLKISYTKKPLGNELFIYSHELLFEQGLSDVEINVQDWESTKCFFTASEKSSLPFDIFAASFYLLSRYEEYLPHVKDAYGRFAATESLAYKHGFLKQPVVDIWAYKFKAVLQQHFNDFKFPVKKYHITPVIDVPLAYCYKGKSVLRTLSESLVDVYHLKFKTLSLRYRVLLGLKPDPYNTYKWIVTKQKQVHFKFIVFFLIGNISTYDKNLNLKKKAFMSLIKSVADYCTVGLKASYMATHNSTILKSEKQQLQAVINNTVHKVRHSHTKVNIPESYRNLLELEFRQDFTMGYPNYLGFRAGTCTPFKFYDLDYEMQTPLVLHSFHCMDFALLKKDSLLDKKEELQRLIQHIKQVNGNFTFIFHNYSFSIKKRWSGFKTLFNLILDSVK